MPSDMTENAGIKVDCEGHRDAVRVGKDGGHKEFGHGRFGKVVETATGQIPFWKFKSARVRPIINQIMTFHSHTRSLSAKVSFSVIVYIPPT